MYNFAQTVTYIYVYFKCYFMHADDTLLGPADDIDPDNPGKDHITTIFIAVAVVVGVGAVGGITVGIGIYKRRQKGKCISIELHMYMYIQTDHLENVVCVCVSAHTM